MQNIFVNHYATDLTLKHANLRKPFMKRVCKTTLSGKDVVTSSDKKSYTVKWIADIVPVFDEKFAEKAKGMSAKELTEAINKSFSGSLRYAVRNMNGCEVYLNPKEKIYDAVNSRLNAIGWNMTDMLVWFT